MRNDISKVIVERPRYSSFRGDKGYKKSLSRDMEQLPRRESMKDRWLDRKEVSDYLTPLEGFLRKSVGKSWNKVYSEIRRNLCVDRTMDFHVIQHVFDFVEIAPMEVWFDAWKEPGYWSHNGRPLFERYYVCPKSGLLKKTNEAWRRYIPVSETYYNQNSVIINNVLYREMKGIWYEIILANVPKEVREADYAEGERLNVKDIVTGWVLHRWNYTQLSNINGRRNFENKLIAHSAVPRSDYFPDGYYWYVYAKDRRQLSSRELRRLGLDNSAKLKMPNIVR